MKAAELCCCCLALCAANVPTVCLCAQGLPSLPLHCYVGGSGLSLLWFPVLCSVLPLYLCCLLRLRFTIVHCCENCSGPPLLCFALSPPTPSVLFAMPLLLWLPLLCYQDCSGQRHLFASVLCTVLQKVCLCWQSAGMTIKAAN